MKTSSVLLWYTLAFYSCGAASARDERRRFPDDFLFGASTAAYQIEGGWNSDGKGESVWDYFVHKRPELLKKGCKNSTSAEIAADSYHNYKRDVEMMRELGLDAYRFSLAWTRILPTGFHNQVNEAGVAFYNNYIDEMLKYNIQPIVTLYHWDLPQNLQELGGWTNPLSVDWFVDYARLAFELFGDRVKMWTTFNEPREVCVIQAHVDAVKVPFIDFIEFDKYHCSKNLLLAHAKTWHVYNDEYRATHRGKCGITISTNWFAPWTDSEDDHAAAEIYRQVFWKQFSHPIYTEDGDYPKETKDRIAAKGAALGVSRSQLPLLTQEEVAFIKGTSDFYGMNHYFAVYISANATGNISTCEKHIVCPPYDGLDGVMIYLDKWKSSSLGWIKEISWSLPVAVNYLRDTYNNPDIYITENGWPQSDVGLIDDERIHYIRVNLKGVLDALEAGINIKSYMVWSLMDNVEWLDGLTSRFGLYEVDFMDPARTRTPRKSAFVYKDIIRTRTLDPDYEPDTTVMSIDDGH